MVLRCTAPPHRLETENATSGEDWSPLVGTNETLIGPRRARPAGRLSASNVARETTGLTGRRDIELDGQAVTALGAPRAKDGTTGLG